MRPAALKEAWELPENSRIRPVLRIKNVRANHPAHEFAMPTSLEYTFLHGADNPTGPLPKPERVQPQALARAPLPSSDQTHYDGHNPGSVLTRPIPPRRYNT
jgi:hypothetical protein